MSRRTRVYHLIQADVLVVGVDVAKHKLVAVSLDGQGNRGKHCRFGCHIEGFERLKGYAEGMRSRVQAIGVVFAMEPTGHYGEPLARWLKAQGYEVMAVPPLLTRRAKELYDGTTRKTDEKDAVVIADLCRRGLGGPWRTPEGPFSALRVLTRRREQLVERRKRVVNRLHRHRDVVFPELGGLFKKLEGRSSRWVLRDVPSPSEVLGMGLEALTEALKQESRGQLGIERATAMVKAAERSVGLPDGLEAHRLAIRQLLDELEEVQRQLAEVREQIEAALAQIDYAPLLLSVPGFGPVVVGTLLGEVGDLRGYRVARQLIKMVGLDLVESSSGEKRGHHHISRRGRPYARQLLYMAALKAGQGALAVRRHRLVEEKNKPPKKAAVANACALLRICHALVRDGVPFDAKRHPAPTWELKAA